MEYTRKKTIKKNYNLSFSIFESQPQMWTVNLKHVLALEIRNAQIIDLRDVQLLNGNWCIRL